MIKKVFKIYAITVIGLLYFLSSSSFRGEERRNTGVMSYTQDTFTNCILNTSYREAVEDWQKPGLHITRNIDKYNELNFNSIQWYDAGSDTFGWPDVTLSREQITNFKRVLNTIEEGGLYGYYARSHIEKYSYGQRLIYEVDSIKCNRAINYGFVYDSCKPNTYGTDSGRTVLHAEPSTHTAGYLCRNIYENLQHSDFLMADDGGMWYIKPVMRIPVGIHDTTSVVRIEVYPFGDLINPVRTITIKAENFKNDSLIYYGNYLEKYFRLPQLQPLKIEGKDSITCLNYGRGGTPSHEWAEKCKVDFRVYWYGQCEVWFDKMIVDDNIANDLFDPTKQEAINYRIWQEVYNFTGYGSNYSFYLDEMVYSMIPCARYVMDKMREYNSSARISFAIRKELPSAGLRNRNLINSIVDKIPSKYKPNNKNGFVLVINGF